MTTTTRSTPSTTSGRRARTSARAAAPRGPRDRIPPHWPDDLDVPVPSLDGELR